METDSILKTIRKMLGMDEDFNHFDGDIIPLINSAFMSLIQIIPGMDTPFSIKGESESWTDFFGGRKDLESVKEYIFLKVKMIFDPPTSSFVIEAYKEMLKEDEFRLSVQREEGEDSDGDQLLTTLRNQRPKMGS